MDFENYRPWVVVIEAFWDSLDEYGYEKVYFDGLNSFYLANEKADELREHFKLPPNVFDEFQLYSLKTAQDTANWYRSQMDGNVNVDKSATDANLVEENQYLREKLRQMEQSRSWRLTKPLRTIKNYFNR